MIELKGKHILLFSPFGSCKSYSEEIQGELLRRGAKVALYDERPSQSVLSKIYIYKFRELLPIFFKYYIKKVIRECPFKSVDYILIVRGQAFDAEILALLRTTYKGCKIYLYQWDSLSSMKIPNVIHLYDRAFSYDPSDVATYSHFKFRPTFYLNKYLSKTDTATCKYDLCFVGTLYQDRWPVLKKFYDQVEKQKIKSYFYLFLSSKLIYYANRLSTKEFAPLKAIHFNLLESEDYYNLVKDSKCILDINYSTQKGLSLRAYEALASNKKYITTNKEIANYDFYSPNNILIVDIDNPVIPKEFIESPNENIDQVISYYYSVSGFIDTLFEE